jgi:hypothetical protein
VWVRSPIENSVNLLTILIFKSVHINNCLLSLVCHSSDRRWHLSMEPRVRSRVSSFDMFVGRGGTARGFFSFPLPIIISPLFHTNLDRLCGLVVRVPGYRSWGLGFDSRRYQIFLRVVGLEWGPLSLVRITEELLEWKSSGSGKENRINYRGGGSVSLTARHPIYAKVGTNFADKAAVARSV